MDPGRHGAAPARNRGTRRSRQRPHRTARASLPLAARGRLRERAIAALHLPPRPGRDFSPLVRADPGRGRSRSVSARAAAAGAAARACRRRCLDPRSISPGRAARSGPGARRSTAGAPILVDATMVRPASSASGLPAANEVLCTCCAIPRSRPARRCAAARPLGGRGRVVAPASRGCGGGDRQCADGAVSSARMIARRGSGKTGADPRLSGRLCRRRRGQGGARRVRPRPRLRHLPWPARRQRPRCRRGQRAWRAAGDDAWLAIVGIGEDGLAGLAAAARTFVETAEVLVGGARHLAMVPASAAERLVWERPSTRTIEAIAARRGRRVAVLASGDPLWYGVGVTLVHRFAPDEIDDRAAAERLQPRRRPARLAARRLPDDQPARPAARRSAPAPCARTSGSWFCPRTVTRRAPSHGSSSELGWGASRLTVFSSSRRGARAAVPGRCPILGRAPRRRSQHDRARVPCRTRHASHVAPRRPAG